ncbi:hypothetical protein AGLY_004199 [Aphis glycines]|uniref:Uncharacterized protein n=1 Tax=Aphis glycines TaxID=307491 RepID=A0A6G0TXW9_APHGL|nr:hypothetical protein AGLY_004199 [Aphis glycines]
MKKITFLTRHRLNQIHTKSHIVYLTVHVYSREQYNKRVTYLSTAIAVYAQQYEKLCTFKNNLNSFVKCFKERTDIDNLRATFWNQTRTGTDNFLRTRPSLEPKYASSAVSRCIWRIRDFSSDLSSVTQKTKNMSLSLTRHIPRCKQISCSAKSILKLRGPDRFNELTFQIIMYTKYNYLFYYCSTNIIIRKNTFFITVNKYINVNSERSDECIDFTIIVDKKFLDDQKTDKSSPFRIVLLLFFEQNSRQSFGCNNYEDFIDLCNL